MRKVVVFCSCTLKGISYIHNVQRMIESKYEVVDYKELKKGNVDLLTVRTIYLNWLENTFDEEDAKVLQKAKRYHVKIVWIFHNKVSHDVELRKNSIESIKFLSQISDKIILHSKSSIDVLQEYNPKISLKRVVYIEHPEFIGQYGKLKSKNTEFGKKEGEFVFGMYGAIRRYKNIEVLIKAFSRLNEEYKCKLLIAGACRDKQYLNELLESKEKDERIVIQASYIEDLEMQTYLDYADVLVLPYSYISSMNSGAMIMAFSYKKTVIVPDICMAEDFPDNLIYKYHYENEQEHIEMLCSQLKKAYENGREKNAMKGNELFDIVEKDYNRECVKEKILRLV